jgi:hypothetical protein
MPLCRTLAPLIFSIVKSPRQDSMYDKHSVQGSVKIVGPVGEWDMDPDLGVEREEPETKKGGQNQWGKVIRGVVVVVVSLSLSLIWRSREKEPECINRVKLRNNIVTLPRLKLSNFGPIIDTSPLVSLPVETPLPILRLVIC